MNDNTKQIENYRKQFETLGKLDIFEINKNFLIDMINTENQIRELEKYPLVQIHPTFTTKQKITETAKMLLKLKELYKNQTVALNKILGNNSEQDYNPFDEDDEDED